MNYKKSLSLICGKYEDYVMGKCKLTEVLQIVNLECTKFRNTNTQESST